ncbi:MAG: methenyltetrahydromethanopterin cyclohydrolase [Candidatus Bathyarchaeota archaeon]|nr:methenyltetrahydromethanopterin cyclohydrolase [Candidatus Bathyarchaeota archaeon]MCX8176839.1 methenyltetrahydromethanopterin cyclohydrolase [Candidatus Bathyarchaeota archaeon]MDW8193477.1 methenyltetrahydromethanopterin cyclohydrolase [Nitrososphaerota archaeon]
MSDTLSVNMLAWRILEKILQKPDYYGVKIEKTQNGATIVDAGIEARGGFEVGRLITEICLGGCGKAKISVTHYGELELPSVFVYTDHPAISTLGSQFAGWNIKGEDYSAIGSGPARALSLKPKEIYEEIGYRDQCDRAIVVLETDKRPPSKLIQRIAEDCHVQCEKLALILTPTASAAGSTQVAGRIVETGLHKLSKLGLDPKTVLYAWGYAPIPPVHPKFVKAMARTNDAILYGGVSYYVVNYDDEAKLEEIVQKAPSKVSRDYGKSFFDIFKGAGYDFYKIDPNIFAPAVLIVNNTKTGKIFKAGEINPEILTKSFIQ